MLKGELLLSGIHLGSSDWHWIMWFLVWIIETCIFAGYILAFISRSEARSVANGFMEVVFPLIIAALPLAITITPMNFRSIWPDLLHSPDYAHTNPAFFFILFVITCGGVINLSGLITLRKAFTIMSEARVLVRQGMFSIIRHPLYTGYFIMFFGYLLFHLYWYTCILYILFVIGQYVRARIEEGKLMSAFPEYADYMRSTGMFFPRLSIRSK